MKWETRRGTKIYNVAWRHFNVELERKNGNAPARARAHYRSSSWLFSRARTGLAKSVLESILSA